MFFRKSPPPKVQGETTGRTLFVYLTEAQLRALFDMCYRLRDDRALWEAWSQQVGSDVLAHEFTAFGISSMSELRDTTGCNYCGLAYRMHDRYHPPPGIGGQTPPQAKVFNLSGTQYSALSAVLTREVPNGPVELAEASEIIANAYSNAAEHVFATNERDSWDDMSFGGALTCIVCGLSFSRHAVSNQTRR